MNEAPFECAAALCCCVWLFCRSRNISIGPNGKRAARLCSTRAEREPGHLLLRFLAALSDSKVCE